MIIFIVCLIYKMMLFKSILSHEFFRSKIRIMKDATIWCDLHERGNDRWCSCFASKIWTIHYEWCYFLFFYRIFCYL